MAKLWLIRASKVHVSDETLPEQIGQLEQLGEDLMDFTDGKDLAN